MNHPTPLISIDEFAQIQNKDQLLIVDCRFNPAAPEESYQSYLSTHIPGAVYAHLNNHLSDLSRQGKDLLGKQPLPSAEQWAATLSSWGWSPELTVIAYDDSGAMLAAARLWWIMHWMNVPVQILDGGFSAYQRAGHPVESGAVERTPTQVAPVAFDSNKAIFTQDLRHAVDNHQVCIVDARPQDRYLGKNNADPVPGHIPGATHRFAAENLQEDKHFCTSSDLREAFIKLIGDRDPSTVVHSCGSGVFACQNLLAMEIAGLHGSKLYAPSWSGWTSDPENPVTTG
ncbi:sulfurtransferase [Candidatus Nitrosacidococcus tergens]|uniref:Rhodanese-related sulfurtransferase n=1 Tax=Candidatus Nitrosacidococcus tergens TaxID=553981 RepID=A0A7G1Q7Q8_9GAMM|nr:sulfurtransferase [Candidatus Nitrosacidococcus tergens]CAB1274686.1 Rhodanese-related sulfurtransferase [Candidatus Nitrosacidococcus tergens]